MPRAIPELLAGLPVGGLVLIGDTLAPLAESLARHTAAPAVQCVDEGQGLPEVADDGADWLPVMRVRADDAATDRRLGAACRRYPARLWAIADDDARLPVYLFSFGFRRVDALVETLDDTPLVLFEFRLHDYKKRPDWLNARYWAHPERFDMTENHND